MTIPQLIQLAAFVLCAYQLLRAMAMRGTPKMRYYLLLALAVFLYTGGYLLELDARGMEAAYFAQRIQYCGVPFIAVLFYLFYRDYSSRGVKANWKLAAMLAFPCAVALFANLYPENRLYFAGLSFSAGPTPHLVYEWGPLYYANLLYSGLFVALSIVEVLRHFPRRTTQEKRKRLYFIAAAALPSLVSVLFSMDFFPLPMRLGPVALVASGLVLGYYILHYRAQDWLPYARESVVEKLDEGYILLDDEHRFLDANAVAKEYFPALDKASVGTPIPDIPGFPMRLMARGRSEKDTTLFLDERQLCLQATYTPIEYEGKMVCTCILLHDITALHNAMQELEDMANRDTLTGILNRGSLFRAISRDFALAQRTRQPACMMMLDIDHFKNVNDVHGHLCGDRVLKQVAGLLQNRLRQTDILGRYGGEEFLIFLPSTEKEGAAITAAAIRSVIEDSIFVSAKGELHITISIGIAQLQPGRHKTVEDLIADADAALYNAKDGGRNRVVAFHHGEAPVLEAAQTLTV